MSIHYLITKDLITKAAHRLTRENGQGLVEYALLISLITIALISSLLSLRDGVHQVLTNIPFP